MEFSSDAQLLKIVLNVRDCYPKLMKEFMVKNDGILHGLLNFSYKMKVRKDMADIVIHIYAPVFDGEMLEIFHLNLLLVLL